MSAFCTSTFYTKREKDQSIEFRAVAHHLNILVIRLPLKFNHRSFLLKSNAMIVRAGSLH